MHFVLLTWNPEASNDHVWTPDEWDDAMVAPYLAGDVVETTWSVGRHINNIEPGDTAFLYRQGDHGRGIVARGVIQTYPEQGPHYDGTKGKTTNFIHVKWHEAVPVELAVDVEQLESVVLDVAWRQIYGSGHVISNPAGRQLARAWKDYVASDSVRAASELYTSDLWRNYVAAEDVVFA